MAKKQSSPVVETTSANNIAITRKIKAYLFRAILQANTVTQSQEKDVLLNELRRALHATASLRARLGDKDAYTERPSQ